MTPAKDKNMSAKSPSGLSSSSAIMRFIESSPAYPYLLFGFMALGTILLFSEFIFSDQMLYGSDTINAGIFFRELLVEHVKSHGHPPFWNPYIFGGMPYVDAFHGDVFYPLSILKYFGDLFRMLGWNLVLHIFLAGVFMYFTARQFKLSRLASSVAALAYMFSGYLVSLVAPGHDGKIFVTTLFPLTILFLDKAFCSRALWNFTLLGLTIGVIILSPHPQMSYFTLWALGFYFVYLLYHNFVEKKSLALGAGYTGGFVFAVVLGLGISAIQFYPGVRYTREFSPRADSKSGYSWATSWSLHQEDIVGLINPEFGGTKVDPERYPNVAYWSRNPFKDNSEYAGVVALFLATVGAFFYRRRGVFFAGLGLFALSYALADTTPLFKLYYYLIPNVKSLRAASMIMFMFSFCVSLLAGMGVHWLISSYSQASAQTRSRLRKHLLISSLSLGAVALLWSIAGKDTLSAYGSLCYEGLKTVVVGRGGTTKWNMALANLPSIQKGFWISFALVGATAAVIWLYLKKQAPALILLAIPALLMIDGIRFGGRFVEVYDYERGFAPNQVTRFLANSAHPGEFFRTYNARIFSGDMLPYHKIELASGYHGNQLRWYDDLLGGPGLANLKNPRFLNLVGTRYLLTPTQGAFPVNYFGEKPITQIKDFRGWGLYENPNYFPRAFLVDSLITIAERKKIYPLILSGSADLSRIAYVEEETDQWNLSPADVGDSVWIEHSGVDSVILGYTVSGSRPVVLTNSFYDAWRARIGEEPLKVFRIDGAFWGVVVPAGTGRVVFTYTSSRFETGKKVTYASLLIMFLALGLGWYRDRRGSGSSQAPDASVTND